MITEDYVSFETAKLLKEKGFDVPTHSVWIDHSKLVGCPAGISMFPHAKNWNAIDDGMSDIYFSAPTLQMAMKWLREVYNIAIDTEWEHLWYVYVKPMTVNPSENDYYQYYSAKYEEAIEAAIKYCLTNLI